MKQIDLEGQVTLPSRNLRLQIFTVRSQTLSSLAMTETFS